MATAEELEQQKKELEEANKRIAEYEAQAKTVAQEKVKERKFGSGVTKESQRQTIERKQKAVQYIEELQTTKQQVASGQKSITAYEEEKGAYEIAERLAVKGAIEGDPNAVRSAFFRLKEKGYGKQYKYFKDLYSYYKKEIKQKPTQYYDNKISEAPTIKELKDSSGKVIGYEDPYTGQSRLPTPTERLTGQPQKPLKFGKTYILPELRYNYPKSKEISAPQFTARDDLGYKIIGYTKDGKEIRELPLFRRTQAPTIKEFGAGLYKGGQSILGGTYNLGLSVVRETSKPITSSKIGQKLMPTYQDNKKITLPEETSYGAITKADITRAIQNPEYGYGFLTAQYLAYKAPKKYIEYFKTPVPVGKTKGFRETIQSGDGIFIIEREKDYYTAQQVIKPVVIDGKQINIGNFKLTSVKVPTIEEYYPSKVSSFFNAPSRRVISKARTDITTSSPIYISEQGEIINRPATFTTQKGKRLTFVSELAGKQEPFTIETFNKLPKQTQLNLQALVERRIGMPVSLERTPYMLPKNNQFSFGEIVSTKRLRVSPRTKTGFVYPKGKRTSVGAVASDVKEILQTPEYSVFKGETIVKDITKPAKITGDIESAFKPNIKRFKDISDEARKEIGDSLGVSVNTDIPKLGLKKGDIVLRDKLKLTGKVAKHEKGHFYDYELDILGKMSAKEKKALYSESYSKLIKRYGEIPEVYQSEEKILREGIAMRYENKNIKALKEIQSGKSIVIEEESIVLKPTDLDTTGEVITGGLSQKKVVSPKAIETLRKSLAVTSKELSLKKSLPVPIKTPSAKLDISPTVRPSFAVNRVEQSQYYGKGTYERTDGGAIPKSFTNVQTIQSQPVMDKYIQTSNVKPSTRYKEIQLQPLVQKDIVSQMNLSRQLETLKQSDVLKQNQQQRQNQATVLKQMQVQKQFMGTKTSRFPRLSISRGQGYFRLPKVKLGFGGEGGLGTTTAYRTFVKQAGKKKYLGGLFERGEALRLGERVATKTLRATFGVEATKQKISAKQTRYTPSNIFRGFKIEKGKKVKLQDTFIQKRGTRLGSSGEVSEILSARRRR
jgi:hypothetical protein